MSDEKRVHVGMKAFLEACEKFDTVGDIAKETGLKPTSVAARMSKYRGAPYFLPLKPMKRAGAAKFDSGEAKALLAKLRGTTVEGVVAESAKLAEKHTAKTANKVVTVEGATVEKTEIVA